MIHLFKEGNPTKPVFLLLHGTGGNEYDLLPVAEFVDPEASILSVRGNILENGMPRFFKRLAEGVFDEEDLIKETKQLYDFINQAAEKYHFDRKKVIALGYSNGANIAASLLFLYEQSLKGAILLHPMTPFKNKKPQYLHHMPVFMSAGENDLLCSPTESQRLQQLLTQADGDVSIEWGKNGHALTQKEMQAAKKWYHDRF